MDQKANLFESHDGRANDQSGPVPQQLLQHTYKLFLHLRVKAVQLNTERTIHSERNINTVQKPLE